MSNLYTENSEKWQALSHVDYFTQFVKAWIPFNAWYKNYYPQLETDRDLIEEIKTNSNRFRDKLESLLSGNDNDSRLMKSHISKLHYQLERHYVNNKGKRITLEDIIIEQNPNNYEELVRSGLKFEVTRDANNFKLIELKITDRSNNEKLLINQTNGFDIEEIRRDNQFRSLSSTQRRNLEFCYEAVNPNKPISLISNEADSLEFGNYKFVNDVNKITKGIITILYLLRNSLFHGEIIPDKNTNDVYEPAYHILHQLVKEL